MKKYKSHKVVEADKIVKLVASQHFPGNNSAIHEYALESGGTIQLDSARLPKVGLLHAPPEAAVGGYAVRYEDGYMSWSPARVFEEGYEPLTDPLPPLPVAGYKPQSPEAVALVNEFKADEERLLRKLDAMQEATRKGPNDSGPNPYDGRWLAIGRTNLEQAFMAINRAVFKPGRAKLSGDA